ncbi:MAG: glycosyltransferase [Ferruginibacter sp.]
MTTVFITIPWFSPAFKAGGPIQSIANMVNTLNEDYLFYIYTSNEDLHGQPIAITQTDQWVEYNEYTKVWYAGKRDRSQHLIDQVEAVKADVLYIIGLFDWHYNIVPLLYAKSARKILSVRGMLHPGALTQKSLKKKIFLQLLKWMNIREKTAFHATDEEEAGFIQNTMGPVKAVYTAANFPRLLEVQPLPQKKAGELSMISVGIISPMKNYLLVLQALQHVKATVHYSIYGPVKENAYWEDCLRQIQQLPVNIRVVYHKELLPHKLPEKLTCNQLFVLPSKSENYGHAIAEALSAGLPVLTSESVPWTGLREAKAGDNIVPGEKSIAESIEYFAAMDAAAFAIYSAGAAAYIRAKVNVEALKADYHFLKEVSSPVTAMTGQ